MPAMRMISPSCANRVPFVCGTVMAAVLALLLCVPMLAQEAVRTAVAAPRPLIRQIVD